MFFTKLLLTICFSSELAVHVFK